MFAVDPTRSGAEVPWRFTPGLDFDLDPGVLDAQPVPRAAKALPSITAILIRGSTATSLGCDESPGFSTTATRRTVVPDFTREPSTGVDIGRRRDIAAGEELHGSTMKGWMASGRSRHLPRLTPAASNERSRTMIDDDREAMALMKAMKKALPIPAYPSKELISLFKQKNIKIKADQRLENP